MENEPKYFRCMTCEALIGNKMIRQGACAGHRIHYAYRVTFWEWLKIKLGIIA